MRLLSAVLFVALTGSFAVADDAKPADPKPEVTKKKVPYRVVKILPETGQVLLFDRIHATHVVAEAGQSLDGYSVEEIDEDEVTLVAENGQQIILTAPPPPLAMAKKAKKQEVAPVDPYSDTAWGEDEAKKPTSAPVDPYGDPDAPKAPGEGGVRVASAATPATATASPATGQIEAAPADPYGDPGIAAFAEAVGAAPEPTAKPGKAKPSTSDDGSDLAAVATGTPTSTTAPATTTAGTTMIARAELDAALADFGRLAGSFKAAFTSEGLRFQSINDGTLLAKAGLRKGDIVTAVDGQPLRSLDDAATLYARSSAMRSAKIELLRAGKPMTLRIAIQ